MTRSRGTSGIPRLNFLSSVIAFALLLAGGALPVIGCGCSPAQLFSPGVPTPVEPGEWEGVAESVPVIDEHNVQHAILQVRLTSPSLSKNPPEAGVGKRYYPSPDAPIEAILVNRSDQTVPAEDSGLVGRTVRVAGVLRWRMRAMCYPNGLKIVTLSQAGGVWENGVLKPVYREWYDTMVIEFDQRKDPIKAP